MFFKCFFSSFFLLQMPQISWSRKWLSSSSMQRRTNLSGGKNRWRLLKRSEKFPVCQLFWKQTVELQTSHVWFNQNLFLCFFFLVNETWSSKNTSCKITETFDCSESALLDWVMENFCYYCWLNESVMNLCFRTITKLWKMRMRRSS